MENNFNTSPKRTIYKKPFSIGFVLIVDILIVISTVLFTHFLLQINPFPFDQYPLFLINLMGFVVVYVLSFLIFKSYQIDNSTSIFKSHFKATCAVLVVVLISLLITYFSFRLFTYRWFTIFFILLNAIFSLVGLTIFRVFLYFWLAKKSTIYSDEIKVPTLLIGTNEETIIFKNALATTTSNSFNITKSFDATTFNLAILNSKHYKALIILENTLSKEQKWDLITACMELDIKVYQPKISNKNAVGGITETILVPFQIQSLFSGMHVTSHKNKIETQIKDNVILITGAAGSIGSEIAAQIILLGPKKIILVDISESALHNLNITLAHLKTEVLLVPVVVDIRDSFFLEGVFKTHLPDIVYHAAAYKQVPLMENQPAQAVLTNLWGTKICADLAIQYKVGNFVFISTDKAVNPSSIMGATKNCAEKYIYILNSNSSHATIFSTTRFGNVLDSNGSVVPLFQKQITNHEAVTITHPEITRYFMTLAEACELVLEAAAMAKGGEVFIFNMGQPVKILDLAHKMIQLSGLVPGKEIAITTIGLRPGEKIAEELHVANALLHNTTHSKIMIVEESHSDCKMILSQITELIALAKENNTEALVSKLKEIVPEFKSLHSVY